MASSDLDPLFLKALKLLQSRSKESRDQLRQLYDEVVAQRRTEITLKRVSDGSEVADSRYGRVVIKKEYIDVDKKRELEKSNLEKLKQDLVELSQDIPAKKSKLSSSASSSSLSSDSPRSAEVKDRSDRDRTGNEKKPSLVESKEKPRERLREIEEDIFFGPSLTSSNRMKVERDRLEREEREKAAAKQIEREAKEKREAALAAAMVPVMAASAVVDDSGSETEVSGEETVEESGEQSENIDEMQFELLGSLSCVICKSLSVTSSNQLVECQECQSLYHQDCHKPPVTDNVNDPRFVWYCSKCTKNLKKIVIKNQKKPVKPAVSVTSRETPVSKPVKTEPAVSLQPFKRIEPPKLSSTKESTTVGTHSGANVGRGLAGLAANLNNRSSTSGPIATPPDSLKIKTELSTNNVGRGVSSGSSGRQESSKQSSGETKSNTVSPGWGTINRAAPSTTGKGDGLRLPVKTVTPASTPSSVVSGPGGKMSQSTLMNADKRLQIMKKKAAAKMAEKRTR